MSFEVELKFAIEDKNALLEKLDALGSKFERIENQDDVYFSHPSKDFAETDEALRIRCIDDSTCLTYKGPLADAIAKTRMEIELPLVEGIKSREQISEILKHLGFGIVRTVSKSRECRLLAWNEHEVTIAIDDVVGLGDYIELELIAEESTKDAARDLLLDLAKELGLDQSERRSYLRLLIEQSDDS